MIDVVQQEAHMLPKTTDWCVRGLGRNADMGERQAIEGITWVRVYPVPGDQH